MSKLSCLLEMHRSVSEQPPGQSGKNRCKTFVRSIVQYIFYQSLNCLFLLIISGILRYFKYFYCCSKQLNWKDISITSLKGLLTNFEYITSWFVLYLNSIYYKQYSAIDWLWAPYFLNYFESEFIFETGLL